MQHKQLVITGIVLPIFVGVVLLLIEHGFFVASGEEKYSSAPATAATEVVNSATPSEPDAVSMSKTHLLGNSPAKVSLAKTEDLAPLIAVADKLYGPDARNEEYQKIIDVAISRSDLETAAQVTAKIYGPDPRNREYTKIISAYIAKGDFDSAEELANSIYGVDERNAEYKRILNGRLAAASGVGNSNNSLQGRRP